MVGPDPVDTGGGDTEEVVITDRELFDQAISDTPPEPKPAEPAAQPTKTPEQRQARDDRGRFSGRQPQQQRPPSQQAAPPQQPQQPPAQARPPAAPQAEDHRVPLKTFIEERDRRQKLEKQLEEVVDYMKRQPQQPQAPQQPQGPKQTIWDNPDEYLLHNVIEPLRAEGRRAIMERNDGLSREYAINTHGEEIVNDAFEALKSIRNTPEGEYAYNTIMAAGHPYGALVKWHQKQRAHKAVGEDPDAWLRQKQQDWLRDPNAQKAMMDYLRSQQSRPTPGTQPNVSLPPSLSSIPASSGRVEQAGDLTDESLYKFATR